MFEVEQDGLVRLARSAVPAKKRRDVVNAEGQDQNDPFQPADATFTDCGTTFVVVPAAATSLAGVLAWSISMVRAMSGPVTTRL